MASLEYIVRPFQSPNSTGATIIPSTPHGTLDKAEITWGGKSTLPKPQVGLNVTMKKDDLVETARDSSTVRIYGTDPGDDSPSYIDVARSDKLYLDNHVTGGGTAISTGQGQATTNLTQSNSVPSNAFLGPAGEPIYANDSGQNMISTDTGTPIYASKVTVQLNNNTAAP